MGAGIVQIGTDVGGEVGRCIRGVSWAGLQGLTGLYIA